MANRVKSPTQNSLNTTFNHAKTFTSQVSQMKHNSPLHHDNIDLLSHVTAVSQIETEPVFLFS